MTGEVVPPTVGPQGPAQPSRTVSSQTSPNNERVPRQRPAQDLPTGVQAVQAGGAAAKEKYEEDKKK